jgi:5-methylthioadenosine/S-adenosylhomocysteine deaminase
MVKSRRYEARNVVPEAFHENDNVDGLEKSQKTATPHCKDIKSRNTKEHSRWYHENDHIDLLITNCSILPVPGMDRMISSGYIAISGSRIVKLGPMAECLFQEAGTVVDGQGQLAMPGLVNGHCHAPMTLFRGLADDLDLATWLHRHIFPAEAAMVSPEMVYWCSKLAAAEMLLSGTTTVADGYFLEDEVARACAEVGLRCVAGQAVIDFPAPGAEDPARNIEVAERFLDRWQGRDPLVTPAVFAHSPYTCNNTTLRQAKALTRKYEVPLFIHAAETRFEQEQIVDPLGGTPIAHLQALGLLDRDTLCVHCVWADAQDIALLRQSGAGVISCPQSNAKLASGRAPLPMMLEQGVRVVLGTDGAASNNSLDLFREMGLAARLHKVNPGQTAQVSAQEVLAMATHGGAETLGLPAGLGRLEPGALADMVLLDVQQPHLQPLHSANLLVYSGTGADVRSVIVNGRLVVENRNLRTMDLPETCGRVRRLAQTAAAVSPNCLSSG